jgi:hypothetical protein
LNVRRRFAAAGLVAALVAALGLGVGFQLAAFALTAVGLLLFVRLLAQRHMRKPPVMRSGAAALIYLVAFFGCIYYAAMRPAEVVDLRASDPILPCADGDWGSSTSIARPPRWPEPGTTVVDAVNHAN